MSNEFLKMNEVKYFDVEYSDLERTVNAFFPKLTANGKFYDGFSFQADQELGDDVAKTFTVKAVEPNKWEKEDIKQLHEGKLGTFLTSTILNYWCWCGFIPEGTYIVETY